MKKTMMFLAAMTAAVFTCPAQTDSVNVTLKNAGNRSVTYKAALIVDGETVTLKDQTLKASDGNQIAVLVINGGHLVLDNCTIEKSGDGVRTANMRGGSPQGGFGQGGNRGQRGMGRDSMRQGGQGTPPNGFGQGGEGGPRGMGRDSLRQGGPGQGGEGGPRSMGRDSLRQRGPGQGGMMRQGGGGGDDSFNFYGTNSAVVALGEGTVIEMKGCKVNTEAEYANAVFAADKAEIDITGGITIRTTKGSSRGLFATTAGVIKALGVVDIHTKGAHCAALATDRGGGTVVVGQNGTTDRSVLVTEGEGSPSIYSTGDITAYNAEGKALTSQTIVIEGKNSVEIVDCTLQGNSAKHGGVMLYQSTSGDASEGTSVLVSTRSTLQNNSDTPMFLVTNTHSIVTLEETTLLDANGKALSSTYPVVTCKNCNSDGRNWGREGSNGGQVEITLRNQPLAGTLLANETESAITITADSKSDITSMVKSEGKGTINVITK